MALQRAGDARAEEIAEALEKEAERDEHQAYWKVERDTLMNFSGDTSPEATAHALKFLAQMRPTSPLLPKAALWLVNNRDQGTYWHSTKQTAMVIFGLTDYLKLSGELRPDFTVEVSVNGKRVLTKRFSESDALAPTSPVIRLAAEKLALHGNKVKISKKGPGRLYWSARAEYYSTREKFERVGKIALNIQREYFKLVPEQKNKKIVYGLEELKGALKLKPGDTVLVRLTLNGGDWSYLLIEDPIPAGAEFIEKDHLYEIKNKPPWWRYGHTRREFHDDHAAFFQTRFDRGRLQYLYLLKIVNPGRFRVSPARVQPMYQPEYLATSRSRIVEVNEEEAESQ